jgi:nicotinamidase/pyrazinamidase
MSTALVVVDFQNDFLPGGALGVTDGHKTQPVISQIARQEDVSLIVLSRDWHPANHVSFSNDPEYKDFSWPPHCVQGTKGAEFDEVLVGNDERWSVTTLDKPVIIVTKGDDQAKEAYSAFEGTTPIEEENVDDPWGEFDYTVERKRPLAPVLDIQYGISRILVVGLALDYCVRKTALDGVAHDFDTTVITNATRPVAYETGVQAVYEMTKAGVKFERFE